MFHKLAKLDAVGKLAGVLIDLYIRLTYHTSRWRFDGVDRFEAALAERNGVILAFWHGRMLMGPAVRKMTDAKVYMLISAHRDGEIIARGVRSFGIDFIRGSSANPKKADKNKGGASAIAQMAAALKNGDVVGVTPDGPRGPGEKVNKGVIRLAAMTGAPILPAAYSTSRGRHLRSWDRFWLAAPFSRGAYVVGEPIAPPAATDAETVEKHRKAVENALLAVTAEADRLAGKKAAA